MKILNEMDYVELYAKKLKIDNKLFHNQKMLINSQIEGSSSLFNNMFKKNFKQQAREYLRGIGLIN